MVVKLVSELRQAAAECDFGMEEGALRRPWSWPAGRRRLLVVEVGKGRRLAKEMAEVCLRSQVGRRRSRPGVEATRSGAGARARMRTRLAWELAGVWCSPGARKGGASAVVEACRESWASCWRWLSAKRRRARSSEPEGMAAPWNGGSEAGQPWPRRSSCRAANARGQGGGGLPAVEARAGCRPSLCLVRGGAEQRARERDEGERDRARVSRWAAASAVLLFCYGLAGPLAALVQLSLYFFFRLTNKQS